MNTYKEILKYLNEIKIIDTHEHLPENENLREKNNDVFSEIFASYTGSDLISAGMTREDFNKLMSHNYDIEYKWKIYEPFHKYIENSGFYRVIKIVAKDIYGIDGINHKTILQMDNEFKKTLEPGRFSYILNDMCNIEKAITVEENRGSVDLEIFEPALYMDRFICPNIEEFIHIEGVCGKSISSFEGWLNTCKNYIIGMILNNGYKIFKCCCAYNRDLNFELSQYNKAEKIFNNEISLIKERAFEQKYLDAPCFREKDFSDYMFHYIMGIASEFNITVQIHTGLQTFNANYINRSNPADLAQTFILYPNINFDLFHIAYPFQNVLTALCKNFRNVYVDMCWAHIISPYAAVNTLYEWLEVLPLNKIIAFGGDYPTIDCVYGHLQIAKENVAKAFAKRVDEGMFSISKACEYADMFFYENPKKLFKI